AAEVLRAESHASTFHEAAQGPPAPGPRRHPLLYVMPRTPESFHEGSGESVHGPLPYSTAFLAAGARSLCGSTRSHTPPRSSPSISFDPTSTARRARPCCSPISRCDAARPALHRKSASVCPAAALPLLPPQMIPPEP